LKITITNQHTGMQETQHVESAVRRSLVAAGLSTEVVADAKKVETVTQFWVRQGAEIEDTQLKPELIHRCSTCHHLVDGETRYTGKTCHLQTLRHCGIEEKVPEHIQKQYAKLRAAWEACQPRPTPITPSPVPAGWLRHPTLPNNFVRGERQFGQGESK
jgi:hypothetical protein